MANKYFKLHSCQRIQGAGRPTATGSSPTFATPGSTYLNTLTNNLYYMPAGSNTGWVLLT